MVVIARTWILALAVAVLGHDLPSADAHLVKWESWAQTHRNLMKLVPEADPAGWRIKRYHFGKEEVKLLEQELGFVLYPEDETPEFYVAHDPGGGFLGVVLFIDLRGKPKRIDDGTPTLQVGVSVNARGEISRVRLYDYRGHVALGQPEFLDQLRGRTLADEFTIGSEGLAWVPEEPADSQLVANASREALMMMKVALGRR